MSSREPLPLTELPELDVSAVTITEEEILADLWYPHAVDLAGRSWISPDYVDAPHRA